MQIGVSTSSLVSSSVTLDARKANTAANQSGTPLFEVPSNDAPATDDAIEAPSAIIALPEFVPVVAASSPPSAELPLANRQALAAFSAVEVAAREFDGGTLVGVDLRV